jgi:hypothetical protein
VLLSISTRKFKVQDLPLASLLCLIFPKTEKFIEGPEGQTVAGENQRAGQNQRK